MHRSMRYRHYNVIKCYINDINDINVIKNPLIVNRISVAFYETSILIFNICGMTYMR